MTVPRMHDDEVEVGDDLVHSLIRRQLPVHADLPLSRVVTWGTDHVIYRLGEHLSVRLPKIGWAAEQGEREARWLPLLATRLPVEVPVPVFVGNPASGYPYRWYVAPWLDGENPVAGQHDLPQLAKDLAAFLLALAAVDAAGAPPPEAGQRGGPLHLADASTRAAADQLRGDADVDALLAVWEAGVHAEPWAGPPRWVHGDLMEGNLLVRDGRLTGVIDWGSVKAGDPAVELMLAWTLLDGPSRQVCREVLGFVDDAMWLRGRAWATSAALQALPYYRDTNPHIVARSWRTVDAVLNDAEDPAAARSG